MEKHDILKFANAEIKCMIVSSSMDMGIVYLFRIRRNLRSVFVFGGRGKIV